MSAKKPRLSSEEYLASFRDTHKSVVGTFVSAKGGSFIIPDDDRLPESIDVQSITDRGQTVIAATVSGLKVVSKWSTKDPDKVIVTEVIGSPDTVGTDVLGIVRTFNLDAEFPSNVIAEAKKVARISSSEIARRTDLRETTIVTIDPEDAKDLDDAISLEITPAGHYYLGVHIADVSHYITEGGDLDTEAFKRGTSVYFPGGVIPMLPTQLSNNICSLNPNVDRLALSCFMTLDRNGQMLEYNVCETVINVTTRLSYEKAQAILDGDKDLLKEHKKIVPVLERAAELAKILEGIRRKRGEVVLSMPEPKIVLCEKTGKIADVVAYPHLLAHRIIETFMILCNETIAEYALEHNLPFIYRIHDKPSPMKVNKLVDMLKPFSIQHTINPENPNGFAYQKILKNLSDDLKPVISALLLRSMQKAKYTHQSKPESTSENVLGHFGLGSKNYCHFTSPIRRLPDLIIHRIIKLVLNNKMSGHKIEQLTDFVRVAAEQSCKTELVATEVERSVDDLKRAEYMNDHIGEAFTGVISGIMDFGVFVYLPNTVEGLVRIENMPRGPAGKEYYMYDERTSTLSSKSRTFKMGDKLDVICVGVNLSRRQIEFSARTEPKDDED
ncbi:MAG: ribonuclease R [Firmicutes bacterium]|nr:ribonuclease R [Bacillota bacterium]